MDSQSKDSSYLHTKIEIGNRWQVDFATFSVFVRLS